jgi:ABC-type multidrug transport system fused ATPase/permease subunit
MVLPLDALWFVVLTLLLAVFCTAPLISVRIFWILILLVIVLGLALTIISVLSRRRRGAQDAGDENTLLEYLRSHGLGGKLSELAQGLGMPEERTLRLLLALEERGAIPVGSAKLFSASLPDAG